MLLLGPLGFTTPWLLTALAALPVLWVILRAVPPSPRSVRFPGTRLLQGLKDPNPVAQRTPWWLLALRLLAIAALILGFAGPVWKPAPIRPADGPLLLVVDAGWAAAPGWADTLTHARREVERAGAAGQPVALLLADGGTEGVLPFQPAPEVVGKLRAAQPVSWQSRYPADPAAALGAVPDGALHTIWFSDGLDHPGRQNWQKALSERGEVTVISSGNHQQSLVFSGGEKPALTWLSTSSAIEPAIRAVGPDPQGVLRELARLPAAAPKSADGITRRAIPIELPSELRNRIARFEIEGVPSAGAVVLADDRVRRRKVALVGDDRANEAQVLLSPMHYLHEAIAPTNDVISGGLDEVLQAAPDVIVLVDQLLSEDHGALEEWVRAGGSLIRFAGPRMAASASLDDEPLVPVRLRPGGRDIGGALAWGDPRGIAAFDGAGPFAGLTAPADVTIRAQVLPQPMPDLDRLILARLTDQTPLITREALDQGQVVLFHTSANAAWSNLPLSGLFPQMMERLIQSARRSEAVVDHEADEQLHWTPESLLDGFGRPAKAEDLTPVPAAEFADGPGPQAPAGTYISGERRAALNAGTELVLPDWAGLQVQRMGEMPGVTLMKWLISLAAALLALDVIGSAFLLRGARKVVT